MFQIWKTRYLIIETSPLTPLITYIDQDDYYCLVKLKSLSKYNLYRWKDFYSDKEHIEQQIVDVSMDLLVST